MFHLCEFFVPYLLHFCDNGKTGCFCPPEFFRIYAVKQAGQRICAALLN